jgi:hypothetical protein
MEFERHVLPLDIAGFIQPVAERGRHGDESTLSRFGTEEPNHGHRPLLRARRERPCSRSAN